MTQQDRPTGWGGEPVAAPELTEVRAAAQWLQGRIVRTPLLPLRGAAREDVFVKPETLQHIGSYKIRGALNWARGLTDEQRARGLSTCSAGNTAQALGAAAQHYRVPARSMLPDTVPANKLEAIESYGVEPVRMPLEQLILYMLEERWRDDTYCYLNPWGDPRMVAGSGTIALEILEDLPEVDTMFVPVGGGGLAAGLGSTLKELRPSVRIVGVQAAASPALHAAFEAGGPVWVQAQATICEGAAVPVVVDEMYPLLRDVVDEVVLVGEDEARAAIRHLALQNKLVVEGAGAISVAALLAREPGADGRAVCILSGGSISAERLRAALTD